MNSERRRWAAALVRGRSLVEVRCWKSDREGNGDLTVESGRP